MLNFTPTGDMREALLRRQPPDTPGGKWGQVEEEVRQILVQRVQRRNTWTCEVAREHPQLVPFIGLDPMMGEEGMAEELERCLRLGARGIKIHNCFQRLPADDRRFFPIYSRAQERGLPVVFHSGWLPTGQEYAGHYARPASFAPIMEAFPNLTVILAHLGVGWQEEAIAMAHRFPRLHFDSSLVITATLTPPPLSDDEVVNLLRAVGPDRVMFASDWPVCFIQRERRKLEALPLREEERRLLFYQNAQRVLGL